MYKLTSGCYHPYKFIYSNFTILPQMWARVSSTDKGLLYPLDRSVFHSPLVAQPGREQNQVGFHRISWYTKSFTLLCLTIQFHYSVIIPAFQYVTYLPPSFLDLSFPLQVNQIFCELHHLQVMHMLSTAQEEHTAFCFALPD